MSTNRYPQQITEDSESPLFLAAEECLPDQFDQFHRFSNHDNRLIRKLVTHGPVLIQGGRGTGKSALMIAATRQMAPYRPTAPALGLYVSLRYVPLLQTSGADYEQTFCKWVSTQIQESLKTGPYTFGDSSDIQQLKRELSELARSAQKRLILLFDDAAHIGRETSLASFFDIFRTLSSGIISCKAAIYPGVTEFGTRFDIYNDASVVDVVRAPVQPGFDKLFYDIMASRYPTLTKGRISGFTLEQLAAFLGNAVLGNVRGFIYACNYLVEHADHGETIGYKLLGNTLIHLAVDYYWPLLDEVKPKLGRYESATDAAQQIAEILFQTCANNNLQSILVHKQLVARYSKSFEILEYAGFIARREASRALKSGGRGPKYAVNLCNLLEHVSGSRMTKALFNDWFQTDGLPAELHEKGRAFNEIEIPKPLQSGDIEILNMPVDTLVKSRAYPYGLTQQKIDRLKDFGIQTVGDLANASDTKLLDIDGVGQVFLERFRSVVGQAIWM